MGRRQLTPPSERSGDALGTAPGCRIVGIVNITEDSFSDGGRYLDPHAAAEHARRLLADGADVIELGPASSHPEAATVDAAQEIQRIDAPLAQLVGDGVAVSVDSCRPQTLRHALGAGAAYLNDVTGFGDSDLYDELAAASAHLVVMHSVQQDARADRREAEPAAVLDGISRFFERRLDELERGGVTRARLIIDPGMGLFLGSDPTTSYAVLAGVGALKTRFGLPVMISVSRKSFLGAATGAGVSARGSATLAAELHAVRAGADYVRTHDVRALSDAIAVQAAIDAGAELAGRWLT